MPILKAGVADATAFFNLNGVDYPKYDYVLYYSNLRTDSSGNTIEDGLQLGLKHRDEPDLTLIHPALITDWKDGTGTPYADLDALLTAMNTLIGVGDLPTGGGGAPNPATFTGTAIPLDTVTGKYQVSAANSATTYTTTGTTLGSFAKVRINAASEPSVTGGTKLFGPDFQANTDMYLVVEYTYRVEYYFVRIT